MFFFVRILYANKLGGELGVLFFVDIPIVEFVQACLLLFCHLEAQEIIKISSHVCISSM